MVVISRYTVDSEQQGKGQAVASTNTKKVTMNTAMPQDPHFYKQYQQHLKCLKLGGLQPKTIDSYARATGLNALHRKDRSNVYVIGKDISTCKNRFYRQSKR